MTAREIAALFDELELQLIASLKRNLARHTAQERREGGKNGVPERWEAWQAAKLRALRRYRRENRAIVEGKAPIIAAESYRMILEQAWEGGADGFFGVNAGKLNALAEELQKGQARVEKAALRYMDDVYRRTVQRAALGMATGAMPLQQATDQAVRDFLAQGINCVQYRDGRRVNIASYAEMALRTCSARAMLLGEAQKREALGIDTVLVSQYGGCSDTCLPWQGIVYIDDVWQPYHGPRTPGATYGVSRNGRQYPLLSVAVRAGLFHPNCRHTLTTWVEGVSERPKPMDKAKIEAVSRLEKRQRALERRVRQAKRLAAGLQDPEAAKKAKAQAGQAQAELRRFVAEHGDALRRDPWRERVKPNLTPLSRNDTMGDKGIVRSPEELRKIGMEAERIVQKHTSVPTRWSGKTLPKSLAEMPEGMGKKEWNCDISLRCDLSDMGIALHEHLHARSASRFPPEIFLEIQKLEEGSVELFTREICAKEKILHAKGYSKLVEALRTLNHVGQFYRTDYEFAKALFETPLPDRFAWLRAKADQALAGNVMLSAEEKAAFDSLVEYFWGKIL